MKPALAALSVLMACGQSDVPVLTLPPVKTTIQIDQQAIEITLWGTASAASAGQLALALTVDLTDLQKHLTPLLAAQLNRSDRCGERLSVERGAMAPTAPGSALTVNVNLEQFACVKAFGKEIVKRLVGGHGVIEVKLTPEVGDNNISLDAEVRKIEADGSLGDLLRSGSLGDSLREEISDSIESAIQKAADLKGILPAAIGNAVTIETVQFADGGAGKLWLTIGGEVRLSADQLRHAVGQ